MDRSERLFTATAEASGPGSRPALGLAIPLVVMVGLQVGLAFLGPLAEARGPGQLLFGASAVAWVLAVRAAWDSPPNSGGTGWVVLGALVLRLIALAGDLQLSDDLPRYVFEGGLVAEGVSPYGIPPNAPERAAFHERWEAVLGRVNHPDVAAAYPPLTQFACALIVALSGGPAAEAGLRAERALRYSFTACDLALLLPLFALLRRRRLATRRAVVWAWCPLVLGEYAGTGHFDSLGILLLVSGVAWLARIPGEARAPGVRRAALGFLSLVAGALVKFLPLVALPFALRERRRPWIFAALCAALFALGYGALLLLDGGLRGVTGGVSEYALRWESFNLVFRWIERPVSAAFEHDGSWLDARRVARGLILAVWSAAFVVAYVRRFDLARASAFLIGAFLVLTPTLHPWYLTWIVPFLALRSGRVPFAWFFLVAVAPLLYWPLTEWRQSAVWVEPNWLWPLVALPFFVLLGWDALAARRAE